MCAILHQEKNTKGSRRGGKGASFMYVIIVYDVEEKRVGKVLKFLRGYLHWVQNSVFEGELTEGKFREVQNGIKKLIKTDKDSVIFYRFRDESQVVKDTIGIKRAEIDVII